MTKNTSLAMAPTQNAGPGFDAAAPLPRTASPASAALSALCLIARLHHVAADPAHLAHQLGWPASHVPSADDLLLAAQHLGLKARRSRSHIDRLNLVPLPALALMNDAANEAPGMPATRVVMLAQCDGQRVLFMDPATAAEGQPARPTIEPLAVFATQWSGELTTVRLKVEQIQLVSGVEQIDL